MIKSTVTTLKHLDVTKYMESLVSVAELYVNKHCVFQRVGRTLHQDHHHPLLTLAVHHHQHCHTLHTLRRCPFPMEPHQLPLIQLICPRSFQPATTPMLHHRTLSKVSLTPSSNVVCRESQLVPVLLCVSYLLCLHTVLYLLCLTSAVISG